jgi:hypothetical protein|tara:strand:+ start:484 stop:657 length:174 start_codon:yes stop_codon:yes gene_type:complete
MHALTLPERRADRSDGHAAIAPPQESTPYTRPETVQPARVQGCWAASGAWANGRCIT